MPQIAIALREWTNRRNGVVRGIVDFAKSCPDWNVTMFDHVADSDIWPLVDQSKVDGIITCLDDAPHSLLHTIDRLGVPVVAIGTLLDPAVIMKSASVGVCPESVASLMIDHLAEYLPRTLVVVTDKSSEEFSLMIKKKARSAKIRCELTSVQLSINELLSPQPSPPQNLALWLQANEPVCVIAGCDRLAAYIRTTARQLGVNVPEQVAILSARDSPLFVLPNLSITGVFEPTRDLGFDAAKTLHRMLSGRAVSKKPFLIKASSINVRESSLQQPSDAAVERARAFIHANAARAISVTDLMTYQNTSRVTFERKFRDVVGRSPGEEIRRVRLEFAKKQLLVSDAPIAEVGHRCGFSTGSKFSAFFKKSEGISPLQFRQAHRQ